MKRLVVDGYGKYVGCAGERIVVKENKKVVAQELPEDIRSVILSGKCSISTDAIIKLCKSGADIVVLDYRGEVVARMSFGMFRTVKTRREQYLGYYDQRGVDIAKAVVVSKLYNQRYLLYTYGKRREDLRDFCLERVAEIDREIDLVKGFEAECIDSVRGSLLGAEGRGSNSYWRGIQKILPKQLEFPGRVGRGARDFFNSTLNYGYAVLEGEVERGIHFAGLDPYAGFLHTDRPGKPSLTLDIMEMFRQQCVDRVLLSLVTKRALKVEEAPRGMLAEKTKRIILKEILSKFEEHVRVGGIKIRWTDLILDKCREVAKYLRGEKATVEPFYLRW